MSKHPRADAPGNVPLWRCEKAHECAMKHDCSSSRPHERDATCHDECHVVFPFCPTCIIVGFRLPPRCEDCGNRAEGIRRGAGEHSLCHDCHYLASRPNYTPRQPGKGGAE